MKLLYRYRLQALMILLTFANVSVVLAQELIPIINMENQERLPSRFRTTNAPFPENKGNPEGLDLLHASGSAQFSQKALNAIINELEHPPELYIVDLRQESHGFINGIAVSWFSSRDWANRGKTLEEVTRIEKHLLNQALEAKSIDLYASRKVNESIVKNNPIHVIVETALTENEVVENANQKYFRIAVTDHLAPSQEDVDRFVRFVKELPQGVWLHFHCAAGEGRTTTFLTMYDMMRNAKNVSFEDIIERQWLLGGILLSQIPDPDNWKYELFKERFEFLKKFYTFCRENL